MPHAPDAKQPTSWRDVFKVHPAANVFPMMGDAELDALAKDINEHGLQEAIVLWDDVVLDGRNRLEALSRLGSTFELSLAVGLARAILPDGRIGGMILRRGGAPEMDPATFVISANIRRRHLTKEQQAELIVKVFEAGQVKNDRAKPARSFSPKSGKKGGSTKDPVLQKAVTEAKKHGISKRTVQKARAKLQGKGSSTTPRKPRKQKLPIGDTTTAPASPLTTDTYACVEAGGVISYGDATREQSVAAIRTVLGDAVMACVIEATNVVKVIHTDCAGYTDADRQTILASLKDARDRLGKLYDDLDATHTELARKAKTA